MTGDQLTRGWVRLARGGILGGSSLVLATAAHVAGGGTLPGTGLLALTGGAVALVAVSLTARRLRFGAVLAVLSIEQLLLHLLFHAASTAASCASVAMPGHAMPPTTVCGSASEVTTSGWAMLVAHAIAVAATAWLLARGERWLWAVVDRVHAYATARPVRVRRRRATAVGYLVRRAAMGVPLVAEPRGPPLALI